MKRLGIYLVYDKQNIIDRYIGYFLKELKSCVSKLIVVCNMEQITQGEEILREYADKIFFRENVGFDAGGFKDALCNLIGWETVFSYDELVLINDSMFGPFCPMREIFQGMSRRDVDFWGLTKHAERNRPNENRVQEHIQSFFLVVRSLMLHSECFKVYWESMPYYTSFEEVVRGYEADFTSHFSLAGYTYDAWADTSVNDSVNLENNYCQFSSIPHELIQKRNFPFLKRKPLGVFLPEEQSQESFYQALNYIERETNYPINLIWDNLIRTFDISDLQKELCLQYVIPPTDVMPKVKIAVVAIVSYSSSCEFVCEYLYRLLDSCTVVVCSEYEDILHSYEKLGCACEKLRTDGLPAFLSKFYFYDYVCVLHDSDMTSLKSPSFVGKSLFYNVWGNLVHDKRYLSGVVKHFEQNPKLGFLTVPQINSGEFFGKLGRGWNGQYVNVRRIADKMRLNCCISEVKPPYRVTNDFWIRGDVIKRLENMRAEDAEYLPYLWSYLAQDAGYYSGIVECADYAAMNQINLQYFIDQLCHQVRSQYGGFQYFFQLQQLICREALSNFCKKYQRIYVYGTGVTAAYYQDLLTNVEAYIVSDGYVKRNSFQGAPVKYLSEIDLSEDCGIVLCLKKRFQDQVVSLLKSQGFTDYFCIV